MTWEISDNEISLACENEFDGQDTFLLVQELLETRKENKQLQAKVKVLEEKLNNSKQYAGGLENAQGFLDRKIADLEAEIETLVYLDSEAQVGADEQTRQLEDVNNENKRLKEALGKYEIIEENTWDLRCKDMPTGGDDYDVVWIIVEHYMTPPKERIIGQGENPLDAIAQALESEVSK